MTDVVLNTGGVFTEYDSGADPEGQSTVIGTGAQWDDGDDDTNAVVRCYRYAAGEHDGFFGNTYAALIGNADGKGFLSFNVRWIPDGGVHAGPLKVGLRVDGVDALFAPLAPIPGSIRNDIVVFRPADATGPYVWDEITTAIGEDRATVFTGLFELPATIGTASGFLATVYELVVTALDPIPSAAGGFPVRRIYPRRLEDRSVYPPPNTQQYGRRTGSSSTL